MGRLRKEVERNRDITRKSTAVEARRTGDLHTSLGKECNGFRSLVKYQYGNRLGTGVEATVGKETPRGAWRVGAKRKEKLEISGVVIVAREGKGEDEKKIGAHTSEDSLWLACRKQARRGTSGDGTRTAVERPR